MKQINQESKRNSSFIQLSKFCLVEFIKTDINNPYDDSIFSESKMEMFSYPLMQYQQFYYDDKYVEVPEYKTGRFYTNSVKKYSVIDYDTTRYASVMSYDKSKSFVDYLASVGRVNTNAAKSEYLSTSFKNVIYDTYRFHFAAGFNINAYEAVVLGVKMRMNNGDFVKFASIKVDPNNWFDYTDNVDDSLVEMNPDPIYINNLSFINYIDVKVPSVDWLNYMYKKAGSVSELSSTMAGRLTDVKFQSPSVISPNGFNETAPVTVICDTCGERSLFRGEDNVAYEIYNISEHHEGSVPLQNRFELVQANIMEAEDGNYFIYRAEYDGNPIDSFLYSISSGNVAEWSMIHQLNVTEHVDDHEGHIIDYVSSRNTMYQDQTNSTQDETSYAEFLMFRPVLKYATNGCVDFQINYTLTMINNRTGENVVKTSSVSSKNVRKYSKNTVSIDINRGSITNHKVYNKIYISKDSSTDLFVDPDFEKKYNETGSTKVVERQVRYPMYVDYNAITVSDDVTGSQSLTSTTVAYRQGDLRLLLKPFDNYFRFKIYTTSNGVVVPLELDTTNTYKLIFMMNGTKVVYESMHDENIDPLFKTRMSLGEITFKVPESDASTLVNSNTRDFYIVYDNYATLQTSILYFGFWFNQSEYLEYQSHVNAIKEQYGIIKDVNERMNDTISAIQSSDTKIPEDVYIPGNVDQASDNSEVASAYKITPVSQNS